MATWPPQLGPLRVQFAVDMASMERDIAEFEDYRVRMMDEIAASMSVSMAPNHTVGVTGPGVARGTQTGRWESGASMRTVSVAAHGRAEALLMSFLSRSQKDEYQVHQSFTIRGSCGTPYRIEAGAVTDLRNNDRYCLVFSPQLDQPRPPMGDLLLARKLLIEADENAFKAQANLLSRPAFYHRAHEFEARVRRVTQNAYEQQYFTTPLPCSTEPHRSRQSEVHIENVEMHMNHDRGAEMRVGVIIGLDPETVARDIRSGDLARALADKLQQHLMMILSSTERGG